MKAVILILISIICMGCTPVLDHTTIKELAREIDPYDGIDRVEATLIAQDFIIRRSLYDRLASLEPYRTTRRSVWYHGGQARVYGVPPANPEGVEVRRTWTLLFKDKRHTVMRLFPVAPFHVVVDEDSGEILNWGMKTLKFDRNDHSAMEVYE